ncbi:MAG: PEP-CTERM sorting domain-containing protein [Verrucomicrobiota bacterium]
MSRILRANAHAATAQRRFGRRRRRKSKMARRFETVAALIPAAVLLVHLMMQSANGLPEDQSGRRPLRLTNEINQMLLAEAAIVPEPSSVALYGLGLGLLFHFRRKQVAPISPAQIPAH